MDVAALIRLNDSIEEAADAVDAEHAATAGGALPDAYKELRERAIALLADDSGLLTELEELCPPRDWVFSRTGSMEWEERAAAYHEAMTLLKRLLGWLKGLIEAELTSQQIAANAQAYAAEKVKQERRVVGFQRPRGARSRLNPQPLTRQASRDPCQDFARIAFSSRLALPMAA